MKRGRIPWWPRPSRRSRLFRTFAAQPVPQTGAPARGLLSAPNHGRTRGAEYQRGQLARVNFMREEPGGRRFLVDDLNGPLYILDKQTKRVHRLPRFQRARRAAWPLPEVHLRAQLRDRPHQLPVRSRLRAQRRLLHDAHGGAQQGPGTPAPKPGVVAGLDLVRLHDHRGDSDADGGRKGSTAKWC